jgi:hypothetical protein
MPLEHFFAEVSQCMFVHSAWVVGTLEQANAGALNETMSPNASIETRVFIMVFPPMQDCLGCENNKALPHRFPGCFRMSRVE